jgi:hypothetical protein
MNLGLFRQFIVRRLALEPARTITTVAGIAVGIAVVVAIQLTNASSVRGFETARPRSKSRPPPASTKRCCPASAGCANSARRRP